MRALKSGFTKYKKITEEMKIQKQIRIEEEKRSSLKYVLKNIHLKKVKQTLSNTFKELTLRTRIVKFQ